MRFAIKAPKDRATATQIEKALCEEIAHARGMNVPVNMLSNAASFTLLVLKRLWGGQRVMSQELQAVYEALRQEAVEERKRIQAEQAEQYQKEQSRVIVPGGDPRRN